MTGVVVFTLMVVLTVALGYFYGKAASSLTAGPALKTATHVTFIVLIVLTILMVLRLMRVWLGWAQ